MAGVRLRKFSAGREGVDWIRRGNAVLWAVRAATREPAGLAERVDISNQLLWQGQRGLTPFPDVELSGSQLEKVLTELRKDGLLANVYSPTTRSRHWLLTKDGGRRLDVAVDTAHNGVEAAPIAPIGFLSRPSSLAGRTAVAL
jgi:hypothetical protein